MKKLLLSCFIGLSFALASCSTESLNDTTNLTLTDNNSPASAESQEDYVQAQSILGNKKGTVPDNGDVNIKIDNLILARRTYNNAVPKMHIDGADAYTTMVNLIDNAKKNLYVETFIFHDDTSGRKIADAIVKKKKQGLEVKVLIDALGIKAKNDSRIVDYLKSAGVDVRLYNKLLVGIHGINITHRKVLIADGDSSMTGGMNFGEEYEKVWHDSMTEFHGEVAQDMQREFFIDWKKAGGTVPDKLPSLKTNVTYGNVPMRVTVTSAHESDKRYQIKHSLLTLIDNAKKRVLMEGAYFSDDSLIKSLKGAAERGVDVQIIMPQKGDSKIFNKINPASAKDLMKSGAKVYFYQPRFSHIKATLVDDFAVVGSANPDTRSFSENQELNVIVENSTYLKDLETSLMANDIRQSNAADLRALADVSLSKKIAESFYEIIDYYL